MASVRKRLISMQYIILKSTQTVLKNENLTQIKVIVQFYQFDANPLKMPRSTLKIKLHRNYQKVSFSDTIAQSHIKLTFYIMLDM